MMKNYVLIFAFLLALTTLACSSARLGAQVLYEFGDAASSSSSLSIKTEAEDEKATN